MTEINGETSAECSALETSAIAQSLERMALAFFDDEGYKSAEFKKRVITLPFGYRIIRPQKRISKLQPVSRPLDTDLHGGIVNDGTSCNTTLNKGVRKLSLLVKNLLVVIGLHKRLKQTNEDVP